MSQFWRNVASDAGATAIGSAAQLALVLALPRLAPVETVAGYVTANALIAVGEMASDFGGRVWATRRFALAAQPGEVFRVSLGVKAIFSTALIAVLVAWPQPELSPGAALLTALIAIVQPGTDPLLWYLRGRERLDIDATIVLGWRIAVALGLAVAAALGGSLATLLAVWLAASLARLAVEARLAPLAPLRLEALGALPLGALKSALRECLPIGLAFVVMSLFMRLGVLALGSIASKEDVAHFGVAFSLANAIGFVATSITVSTFPALSRHLNDNDLPAARRMVERKFLLILLAIAPICVAGLGAAPWLVMTLFPRSYEPAAHLLAWLMPGLLISSINYGLKYLLNALGLNWLDALSAAAGCLAFLAFLLIPHWTDPSAAATVAWPLGEMTIFVAKAAALKRQANVGLRPLVLPLAVFLPLWAFGFAFGPAAALRLATP